MAKRNPDRMLLKEQLVFNRLWWEWCDAKNGKLINTFESVDMECRWYEVETPLGTMNLTANGHWVACSFHDVKRAVAVIGTDYMNSYSGKWNHWILERKTGVEAFKQLKWSIEYLLAKGVKVA